MPAPVDPQLTQLHADLVQVHADLLLIKSAVEGVQASVDALRPSSTAAAADLVVIRGGIERLAQQVPEVLAQLETLVAWKVPGSRRA